MSAHEMEASDATAASPTPEDIHCDSNNTVIVLPRRRELTTTRALIVGLVVLVVAAFANSVRGDFVYDDRELIVTNRPASHWDRGTLARVFSHDSWAALRGEEAGNSPDSIYYRPVFILFLLAAHSIAGQDPTAWHLLALLLHTISTILVFGVLEKSLAFVSSSEKESRWLVSALAAAVFAVHPAQTESVAWVSGLLNPLSGALVLFAAYSYLNHRKTNRRGPLVGALALFAVAVLTKENCLVFVLIVALYEIALLTHDGTLVVRVRSALFRSVPFCCIVVGYFVVRYSVLGVLFGKTRDLNFPDDRAITFLDNLQTLPSLITGYLKIAFFPVNLSLIYDLGYVKSLTLTSFWLPVILVAAVAAALVPLSKRMPEVKLAAIWMIVPLLPHLNTRAFVSDEIIHDRYLYLSLIGVGLLISSLIFRTLRTNGLPGYAFATAAAVLLGLLGAATVAQNRHWRGEGDLWHNAARHAPNSRTVRLALGTLAEDAEDFDGALREYEGVLTTCPDVIDALNNSGFVYARQRRWADATRNFERIVVITPAKPVAHFNLSFAYAVQKRYGDATREQRMAIDLDPNGPRADEWRARLGQLEQALATAPTSANPG